MIAVKLSADGKLCHIASSVLNVTATDKHFGGCDVQATHCLIERIDKTRHNYNALAAAWSTGIIILQGVHAGSNADQAALVSRTATKLLNIPIYIPVVVSTSV